MRRDSGGRTGAEVILRVEDGVAIDEVDFAVEVGGSGFGDDFDAAAAGAGEFGGVGIVVDADLLNGGGGDACTLHLDAVDDEGDTAGGAGGGVEEGGESGDVVLVEDGEFFQVAAGDADGVAIGGGVGREGLFCSDVDLLVDGLGVEGDFYCGDAGGEAECLGVGGEAGEGGDCEREGAGVQVGEEEVSGIVDRGLGEEIAGWGIRGVRLHLGPWRRWGRRQNHGRRAGSAHKPRRSRTQ